LRLTGSTVPIDSARLEIRSSRFPRPRGTRGTGGMTRREHTIIFVPHARARFRQFRVSSRLLISVASATVLSVLLGVTFSVLWVQSIRKNREASTLAAENRDLR